MSMRSYFVHGVGFEVCDVEFVNVLKFFKNHLRADIVIYDEKRIPNLIRELSEDEITEIGTIIDEDEDIPEKYEALFDDCLYYLTIYDLMSEHMMDLVAYIIRHETNISVAYERAQPECIGDPSIMLVNCAPWEYNKYEQNLTREEFVEVLEPYAMELGLKSGCIDDLEIEYYG